LLTVHASERSTDERKFLEFETLTVVPLDRHLIDVEMLTRPERAWVDAYHDRVFNTVGPELDAADRIWLEKMTAPLD